MNNNWKVLFLCLLSGLASEALMAQQQGDPLMKVPPSGAMWTVRVEYPGVPSKPKEEKTKPPGDNNLAKPGKEVLPTGLVMKTGRNGISMGQISYDNGTQETFYMAEGLFFFKASNTGKLGAISISRSDLHAFQVNGFPGAGWIEPTYRKGLQKRGDQECYYFYYDVPEGDPQMRAPGKMEAWIQKNGYPLEIHIHEDRIFHFGEIMPFAQDITLPPEYAEVLAKKLRKKKALELMRQANAAR